MVSSQVSQHNVIRGCNINLNGLSNKIQLLREFIKKNKLQLMCVTESHLTSDIMSSIIEIPHFTLLRNDVKGLIQKHGVSAYVSKELPIDGISYPASNVLMFRLISFNIHIIIVYRPPSYSNSQNEQLASLLESVTTGKESILLGDFNLPNVCWKSGEQPSISSATPTEALFIEAVNSVGLTQWVTEPTYPRSGNTLDLIFTTESDCMGKVDIKQPLPACDHCPVVFEYIVDEALPCETRCQNSRQLAWHQGNYVRLRKKLSFVDWDFEFAYLSVSEAYIRFVSKVLDAAKQCVPEKRLSTSEKELWKKNPPRKLVREKNDAWNLGESGEKWDTRKFSTLAESL